MHCTSGLTQMFYRQGNWNSAILNHIHIDYRVKMPVFWLFRFFQLLEQNVHHCVAPPWNLYLPFTRWNRKKNLDGEKRNILKACGIYTSQQGLSRVILVAEPKSLRQWLQIIRYRRICCYSWNPSSWDSQNTHFVSASDPPAERQSGQIHR